MQNGRAITKHTQCSVALAAKNPPKLPGGVVVVYGAVYKLKRNAANSTRALLSFKSVHQLLRCNTPARTTFGESPTVLTSIFTDPIWVTFGPASVFLIQTGIAATL